MNGIAGEASWTIRGPAQTARMRSHHTAGRRGRKCSGPDISGSRRRMTTYAARTATWKASSSGRPKNPNPPSRKSKAASSTTAAAKPDRTRSDSDRNGATPIDLSRIAPTATLRTIAAATSTAAGPVVPSCETTPLRAPSQVKPHKKDVRTTSSPARRIGSPNRRITLNDRTVVFRPINLAIRSDRGAPPARGSPLGRGGRGSASRLGSDGRSLTPAIFPHRGSRFAARNDAGFGGVPRRANGLR